MLNKPLISFDYAIKYLLKDKGNYDIVEGFLSALLHNEIHTPLKITALLDCESNKEHHIAKKSIADLVVEDQELVELRMKGRDGKTYKLSHVFPEYYFISTPLFNDIIKAILVKNWKELEPELTKLIKGETIEVLIDPLIALPTMDRAFWSLLFMGGYIKIIERSPHGSNATCKISLTNEEIKIGISILLEEVVT